MYLHTLYAHIIHTYIYGYEFVFWLCIVIKKHKYDVYKYIVYKHQQFYKITITMFHFAWLRKASVCYKSGKKVSEEF